MSPDNLDRIFEVFARYGDRCYGERVSQVEHAIQCAVIAEEDGACDNLVAASLLHDYGHLVELQDLEDTDATATDDNHELIAADVLASVFGAAVVQPIALHVAAKRYLCRVEPGYLDGLSAASAHSLVLQGGVFTQAQADLFMQQPFAEDAVRLRRYDDLGKREGWDVGAFERFRPLLERMRLRAPDLTNR